MSLCDIINRRMRSKTTRFGIPKTQGKSTEWLVHH